METRQKIQAKAEQSRGQLSARTMTLPTAVGFFRESPASYTRRGLFYTQH